VSVRTRIPVLAVAGALVAVLAASAASARSLFTSTIVVDGVDVQVVGVDSVRDLPDLYSDTTLEQLFPAYDPTSSVSAVLDFRGLPATLSYAAGSTTLQFQIPGVLSVQFDAASRDEAQEFLEDWLTGDFESALAPRASLEDLLAALVHRSPIDPVAGNPNSLQTRMFDADWRLGNEGPFLSGVRLPDGPDLFSTGPELATTSSGPWRVNRVELPLSYRANFRRHPGFSFLLDLPLALTSTEGQLSGLGSLGAGFQIRPLSWLSFTPLARAGIVGSDSVGALAVLYTGSLTSRLTVPLGPFELGVANLVGYSHTYDGIEVGDLELEYDLENFTMRNGGSLSGPLAPELFGAQLGFEVFGSDQRFYGDDLFLEAQHEVGAALVLFGDVAGSRYQFLHLGASYVWGEEIDGAQLELRLRF